MREPLYEDYLPANPKAKKPAPTPAPALAQFNASPQQKAPVPAPVAEKVTVVKGDTLSAIAKENDTTVAKIMAANPQIANANKINVGQKITIPVAAATVKPVTPAAPVAPTSGIIPNFTPSVVMPTPAVQPGQPGFVGPVAPTPKVTLADLEKESADATAAIDAAMAEAEAAGIAGDAAVSEAQGFKPAGTILRYKPGSTPGTRIAVYADGAGGEFDGEETNNPVNPGSTGFEDSGKITLAANTFANTLALLIGESEAGQPWVEELRGLAQGFINTGSDVTEAINLALREAKAQGKASKFVNRFSAIFKLQDRLNAGETVQVPSIADYVQSEQQLGDVFRNVGLGELATQEVMAKVFGDANKSVSEATAIISDIFSAIDNAPAALKADLQVLAPGADRTSIAKALLLGKDGINELTKKVASIEQVSAAKSQGVTIDSAMGSELAAGGETYGTSLGKFATVKQLERGQTLGRMSNIGFTQEEAIASTFQSSAAADEKIRKIKEEEANRFAERTGYLPSQNRSRDF